MRKAELITICLFILITTCVAQQSEKTTTKVACVGNSITAGSGIKDTKNNSYPAVLGKMLGERYEVKNFGFSGRTLLNKGDRPYMKEQMYQDALNFQPDIVVIKLGTNDTKPQNWKYKEEYKKDMLTIINEFQSLTSTPQIYVCYPAKAYDVKWGINDSIIVNDIIPIINEVAKEKNINIIDIHTATSNMEDNFPDKIHPNEAGAIVLAKEVYYGITGKDVQYIESACKTEVK